ncbi:hypothetical protein GCM10018785_32950 [Streptomyces longispororuber]|uniref:Uncharacterized protein n=1 Tax=Streptomyces longispororuber TaxID=68230 RepID=A0A918ZMZ3_9ACTN|nr:hypothetical protein [Streptomyces longispororuber]GHE61307.1 hypothetical protein GCM10018785_32950 [Streptomyces longispororuber]
MKPLTSLGARTSATSASLLRLFVLSGILTVLLTRAFLALAGYPKLGSKDPDATVHISHMLWGGLLMTVSQVALLGLTGRRARIGASAVGGVGFGLFIDQVGKQVSNEGYLYAPAAGLIYLSFAVLVAIAWRADDGTRPPEGPGAATARTAQAAELVLHGVGDGLTTEERARAQRLLRGATSDTDRALLRALDTLPAREPRPSAWRTARDAAARLFAGAAGRAGVVRAAVVLALVMGFLRLGRLAASGLDGPAAEREWNALVAALACATVTWGLYVYGARTLRRDRAAAFRALRAGILIDLLPGQVLNFTIHQFSAVQDLVVDVLLLGVVTAELQRISGRPAPGAAIPAAVPAAPPPPLKLTSTLRGDAGDVPAR